MDPKVSVLIACWNSEHTIQRCIESILSQTYLNLEIIACDDGSTDGTFGLLQEFAQRDSRVIPLRSPVNRGAASARNLCLASARGAYIAIQDADDYSSPDRIKKEVDFLEHHPEFAFVSAGMVRFDEVGEWSWYNPPRSVPLRWDFLSGPPFAHAATLFRRTALQAVGGYRVAWETRRGQDYDLFFRLCAAGYRGANLPGFLYFYLQDRNAFSRKHYRYRVAESVIRLKGYRQNRMLLRGLPYLFKPLAAGLLPKFLLRRKMQRASSGPVRVLQVVSSLGYGGVALSLRTFAERIAPSCVRFDYFTHFGQEDYHRQLCDSGSRIHYGQPIGQLGVAGYVRQWLRLLGSEFYDVVVIHTNYQAGLVAFCAKLAGIPVRVCHVHGSYIYPDSLKKHLWLFRRLISLFATHRWACSREVGGFYYPDSSFTVIPEPIDLRPYRRVSADQLDHLRKELGIPPRAVVWGHVGRFSREKNHLFLLRLFRMQLERHPDTYLVLAGDGELFASCQEQAVRLGVFDSCRFLGNRGDIPALMQLFDLFLLPSVSEGFPNVAVQAQAAGTPALLSDRVTREVDFGAGLVDYARLEDCEDWLRKAKALAGRRVSRESTGRILAERGYEALAAAEKMQAFFTTQTKHRSYWTSADSTGQSTTSSARGQQTRQA
ncbi:MAG: glycosyltransferase [Massilioclostridium sp.]|nr:glycosyltransferase [Massilioclostridium sp.]